MQRLTSSVLLLPLALVACTGLSRPAPHDGGFKPNQNEQRALDATVILLDEPAQHLVCAGEFVARNVFATAQHCIESATGFPDGSAGQLGAKASYLTRQQWEEGTVIPKHGTIFRESELDDVALILTIEDGPAVVPLGEPPSMMQPVFSIGHPDGQLYTVAAGLVTIGKDQQGFVEVLISIDHGSSGGGLYDLDWQLIGTASMMNKGGSMGFFHDVTAVRKLLEQPQ